MIVVYGGSSSGKSMYAESVAQQISTTLNMQKYYIATMENQSDAARERIHRHVRMREGKGFVTIEEMYHPNVAVSEIKSSVILVECVSNLVANVLFARFGETISDDIDIEKIAEDISDDIYSCEKENNQLIVVTNDVFSAGSIDDNWCRSYLKCLGLVNQLLAYRSATFIEVTSGIPFYIKGEKNWL